MQPPALTVVVPVLDGRTLLEESLPPLVALGGATEVLVVDDGSRDGSADLARALGARVVVSGGRALGPARARNVGVEAARGGVVAFVDADVVVAPGAVEALAAHLDVPGVVAAYGSYDDGPRAPGLVSRYANLRHHHYHRAPLADSPSFWSGLGAVRREAFLAVGGFDVERFPRPSVEDIDLGRRLRAAGGRIVRDPSIRGTHLKRWTARELLATDVRRRAWPWARMMAEQPGAFDDLNVSRAERAKALLAGANATLVGGALIGSVPAWAPAAGLSAAALADRELLALLRRSGGSALAAFGFGWHQLYYLYSAGTFVAARLVPRPRREGTA